MEITVDVKALTKILTENKKRHRTTFDKAVKGYQKKALSDLDKTIKSLKAGHMPNLYFNLPVPIDHTEDYDRALQMLKIHADPEITMGEREYRQLVDDDWGWKREWVTSNTALGVRSE